MNSEIHFVVNEELVELENILKDIQYKLENPELEKNKLILQSFITACIKASKKHKKLPLPAPLPSQEEFQTIKEIKRVPKKKKVYPIPIPSGNHIKEFKTKTKFRKEEVETKLPKSQVPLIQDKFTNKPLAIADINDKYIIREPAITQNEIKILKQVISKKPENPEQAWKYLKQASPDLEEKSLTNIKYYLVNSLFALGRLEPLFHDEEITGIQCDGVGEYLVIRRAGKLLKTNIIFKDSEDLNLFIKKLAKKFDKVLDEKNPIIDTTYRDYRFQIILGLHGASSRFTIKKLE